MPGPSDTLRSTLLKHYRFWPDMLDIAWRAHFKCEYCSRDMLASVDDYERNWRREHVVPTKHDGNDSFDNWSLACLTCNLLKSDWNPRTESLPDLSRDALIVVVRAYVQRVRAIRQRELAEVRVMILEELPL